MPETTYFPRYLILGGAMVSGVLLAAGRAYARRALRARPRRPVALDSHEFMPAGAAIAWWLIASVRFSGGYFTANLMHSAVAGQIRSGCGNS